MNVHEETRRQKKASRMGYPQSSTLPESQLVLPWSPGPTSLRLNLKAHSGCHCQPVALALR
jgi:hypothetical protein